MISFKNVNKSYDGKKKAVNNVCFEVKDGEIFGLLGPNGAGKSTLLKMLVGILAIDEGQIVINGHDITTDTMAAKKEFAYVSDSPDNLLRLKGHEFLRFIADVYDVPEELRWERVKNLMNDFGMQDAMDEQLNNYSHGMRQKMMVMGALMVNPRIWIMDEPMVGLDPKAAFEMKKKMREHADNGNIVLFSTHVLDVAEKLVDRIGVIAQGEIKFIGTVTELRELMHTNASLEDLFLELTDAEETRIDTF